MYQIWIADVHFGAFQHFSSTNCYFMASGNEILLSHIKVNIEPVLSLAEFEKLSNLDKLRLLMSKVIQKFYFDAHYLSFVQYKNAMFCMVVL